MIQPFIDKFMAQESVIRTELKAKRPEDYDALMKRVIETMKEDDGLEPDPERITIIDHGDYQGTRLYIIGATGYQPSTYWSIFVDYGSCSGCDSFEANRDHRSGDDEITDEEVNGNWTMMLHMAQSMKRVGGDES